MKLNSKLGTVYSQFTNYTAEGTQIAKNTYYSVCYMNLQPGTYIVRGAVNITASQSATLYQGFCMDDGTNYGLDSFKGTQRYIPSIYLFKLDQPATIYLRARVDSSGDITCGIHGREMMAIKLK